VDFTLTADQIDVRRELARMLAIESPPDLLREPLGSPRHARAWAALENFGALDLEPSDLVTAAVVAEELGYVGFPGPWAEHTILAASALASTEQGRALLGPDRPCVITTALPGQGGTAWLEASDVVLVAQDDGKTLAALRREHVVAAAPEHPLDRSRPVATGIQATRDAAALTFATADLDELLDLGSILAAAQLVGLTRRMIDLTVAYVRERTQFGRPIGSYQAVAHQLANVRTQLEFARPLVLAAAATADAGLRTTRLRAAMAKAKAGEVAQQAARSCLQCHGAIGYSEEYDLQLFMCRTWSLARSWRSVADSRALVVACVRSGDNR
jgi:hypothetical protein